MVQKEKNLLSPHQYVKVWKRKTFLALIDTWSSQILAGVHTMGNVGGEIERAS